MRITWGVVLAATALCACSQSSGAASGGGSGSTGGSGSAGGGAGASGGSGVVFPLGSGKTTVLPATLAVRGAVLDAATAKPVSGATVTWATGMTTTDSRGAFVLQAAPGRLKLTVASQGRVSRVVDAVVIPESPPLRIRLAPVQKLVNLDGAAHTVALGNATLELTPSSFAGSGVLAATFLDRKQAARSPAGPRFFRTSSGTLMRVTGQLSVVSSLPVASPIRVTVPTRGSPAMARLFFLQGDGTVAEPGLAPVATSSSTASFDVPHFTDLDLGEVTESVAQEPAVVTDTEGAVELQATPSSTPEPAEVGDEVAPGGYVLTEDRGAASIESPAGHETVVSGDAQLITYEVSPGGDAASIDSACRSDPDCSTRAVVRSTDVPPPATKVRFLYRNEIGATMGVRGTVASMAIGGCINDPTIQLLKVAVSESEVDVHSDTDVIVTQGHRLAVCLGCKNPNQTGCCDETTGCDGGCCDLLTSTCATGDEPYACGKTGAACSDCLSGGLGCFPQGCAECGLSGQPCCPAPKLPDAGTPPPYCLPSGNKSISFCDATGTCSTCGVTDAVCCSADLVPGTGCLNDSTQARTCVPGTPSTCDNCGGRNQRCCSGGCFGPFTCGALTPGICN